MRAVPCNAMTVDVEDYFQVSAFEAQVSRERWNDFESRVCRNTDRLLELFADHDVTATFFVLGWVADRYPDLVRRIAAAGHEIGSHGYWHRLTYEMSPHEFRADVRQAKAVLEAISGQPVLGYRAPSYSITKQSMWALDVLIEEGHVYDSSIYPIHHDRYGVPDAPRHCHRIERASGGIWEMPGSTVRYFGNNLPIGGGGYFRQLPYEWTRRGIRHVNTREGKPVIFYLHPWEIDPHQPRLHGSVLSRLRHYRNLATTETRLRKLVSEFQFGPLFSLLTESNAGSVARQEFALTPA
jgi:polysaccharide deacetylase family protein (PEP-CTERM system associated)